MTAGQRDVIEEFNEFERAVIMDLAQKQDLSPLGVLRQALRLYQLQALGKVKIIEDEPPVGLTSFDD